MSRRTVLGLLLLCAAAVAVRGDDDGVDESAVVVLKDAEFEKQIGSKKYMLVRRIAALRGRPAVPPCCARSPSPPPLAGRVLRSLVRPL